jgi:predicted  nucleic acid-binding Zn-ribbon protein
MAKKIKESPVVKKSKTVKRKTTDEKQVAEKVAAKSVAPVPGKTEEEEEITIEQRLIALFSLQQIDSQIDKIRIVRGELPLEVQDLEDEIAGLETRINNYKEEVDSMKKQIAEKKNAMKESEVMIKKYEQQQNDVRNNREYDSLSKEIEFQSLEIQLSEKRIKEFTFKLDTITEEIDKSKVILEERHNDLLAKKGELNDIISDTEKDENDLIQKSSEHQKYIEERLLNAYQRIRKNARNGLAVVHIERDACGGCFNKIPPQSQLDIRMHKKIIVCEYCGRIIVDEAISKLVLKEN